MANKGHLAMLRKGADYWNEWVLDQAKSLVPDLSRANFSGAVLHGANLIGADLSDADFRRADLSNANLGGAYLNGTNFISANFNNASLANANLNNANLEDANLTDANLNGAGLSGTKLSNADLSNVNLNDANLSKANFNGANLIDAILTDVNLSYSNFNDANLSGANLKGASFHKTLLGNTDLTGVIGLEGARHRGPSVLDHQTLMQSGRLPINFLRGCGLPEPMIDYLPSLLSKPIAFYSCFISYSHNDKVFARRLHDQLQGQGIRCWLDEHQLLPGDDIYEQVDQGIKLWDKVLLCASKSSLTSWWVDNEIDAAFKKEQRLMKQRKNKVWSLIPLNLDGYIFSDEWDNGKAGQVKSRLAADFTGWESDNDKFEQAFERVVKALKTDDAGRETAPISKL